MPTALLPPPVAKRYPYSYALVDVETTGLNAQHDRVVQIAVALMAPSGQIEDRWSTFVDSGVGPGPTHIHGITQEMLHGAPTFSDIISDIAQRMTGRVMVAHNAGFDWGFLDAEMQRHAAELPVSAQLCTVKLARRLDLPIPGFSLGEVSSYWGIPQFQAHNAEDDIRVLTEVLRCALIESDRIGISLPLTTPRRVSAPFPDRAPRVVIPHQNPGPWSPGTPLRKGMSVAVTGPTKVPRRELYKRMTEAGLQPRNSVSRQTSLVVCNDANLFTVKHIRAQEYAIHIVREDTLVAMLSDTTVRNSQQTAGENPQGTPPPGAPGESPEVHPDIPRILSHHQPATLAVRRVLVLGGTHQEAAAVRRNIMALGGQAAVRMTATVTDLVLLKDASTDRRWSRVCELGLRVLDPYTLEPVETAGSTHTTIGEASGTVVTPTPATVLPRGGIIDLPQDLEKLSLTATWSEDLELDLDVVAFVLRPDERVGNDSDFCFFNQPAHPSGFLRLTQETEGAAEVQMDLKFGPEQSIVIAAALEPGATFGDIGPIEISLHNSDGATLVDATLDAATDEQTMLLGRIYPRDKTWRFRAEGQGYTYDLASLARMYGVDVKD